MINITVQRRFRGSDYTIGTLFINGQRICDTLEDTDRGLRQTDPVDVIRTKKIYGETAIPYGKYKVIVNTSPRFKRLLPRLLDVPGFEGVLIHAGNTPADTHGCILPGENTVKGKVLNSRFWEKEILKRLEGADLINIEII